MPLRRLAQSRTELITDTKVGTDRGLIGWRAVGDRRWSRGLGGPCASFSVRMAVRMSRALALSPLATSRGAIVEMLSIACVPSPGVTGPAIGACRHAKEAARAGSSCARSSWQWGGGPCSCLTGPAAASPCRSSGHARGGLEGGRKATGEGETPRTSSASAGGDDAASWAAFDETPNGRRGCAAAARAALTRAAYDGGLRLSLRRGKRSPRRRSAPTRRVNRPAGPRLPVPAPGMRSGSDRSPASATLN